MQCKVKEESIQKEELPKLKRNGKEKDKGRLHKIKNDGHYVSVVNSYRVFKSSIIGVEVNTDI